MQSDSGVPFPAKVLIVILSLLFVALVLRLVFGDGSVQEVWRLHQEVDKQRLEIELLQQRNQALNAEVMDLKKGLQAVEERARAELGMIREGEVFYQFIDREGKLSPLLPEKSPAAPPMPPPAEPQ